MHHPTRALLTMLAMVFLVLATQDHALAEQLLEPPVDDAEAAERGLRFTVPLALDPDESVFWVCYTDAAGIIYYQPLDDYDAEITVIKQGMELYPTHDLASEPITVNIDPSVHNQRTRLLPKLDGFESLLRDGIKEHRDGRRGPIVITAGQAEALAKRSLLAIKDITDTSKLLKPLTEQLVKLNGEKGTGLIRARKTAIDTIRKAVLSEHFAGTFAPTTNGIMVSKPPLEPPAARPWTNANKFPAGPDTTLIDAPHNRDGTIDYIAGFDEWLAARVKPEDNVFALLVPYTSFAGYFDQSLPAALIMFETLGVDPVPITTLKKTVLPPTDILSEALLKPHFYVPQVHLDPYQQSPSWSGRYKYHLFDQLLGWRDALLARSKASQEQGEAQSAINDAALVIALMQRGADQHDLGAQPEWNTPQDAVSLLLNAAESGELSTEQWGQIRPLLISQPATTTPRALARQSRMLALNVIMQSAVGKPASPNFGDMPVNFLVEMIGNHSTITKRWKTDADLLRHDLFDQARAMRGINTFFDRVEKEWVDLPYSERQAAVSRELEAHRQLFGSFILGSGNDTRLGWINKLERLFNAKDREGYTDHMADMLIAQTFVGHLATEQRRAHQRRFIYDAIPTLAAIYIYKNTHGDWPASLDALVPDLLPDVPTDPFNNEPIRYDIEAGEPTLHVVGDDLRSNTDDDTIMPIPTP